MFDEKAAATYVVRELGKHRRDDDIAQAMCLKFGMSYRMAQNFINKVKSENKTEIKRAQSPLIVGVGLLFLLGGVGTTIWITLATFQGTILYIYGIPYAGNGLWFATGVGLLIGGLISVLSIFKK
jgi:hypothetical protein